MPTWTALTTLPGREKADALGAAMEFLTPEPQGVGVFELEDGSGLWEVGGYFTEDPDGIALDLLAASHGAKHFAVSELPETDWVAHVKRQLAPVEAGRFFVYGSHDADKLPEGRIGLHIDAAMAFGTGHHGTTQGCLLALDKLIDQGLQPRAVADIGCGTAVLAMAAARIWGATVIASDIDPVAVEVAVANVQANGLSDRVHCLEATGFEHPDLVEAKPFDLVFANILKAPLVALAPEMSLATNHGGYAILSGILNEQAADVRTAYEAAGMPCVDALVLGDWTTLTLRKT